MTIIAASYAMPPSKRRRAASLEGVERLAARLGGLAPREWRRGVYLAGAALAGAVLAAAFLAIFLGAFAL